MSEKSRGPDSGVSELDSCEAEAAGGHVSWG